MLTWVFWAGRRPSKAIQAMESTGKFIPRFFPSGDSLVLGVDLWPAELLCGCPTVARIIEEAVLVRGPPAGCRALPLFIACLRCGALPLTEADVDNGRRWPLARLSSEGVERGRVRVCVFVCSEKIDDGKSL